MRRTPFFRCCDANTFGQGAHLYIDAVDGRDTTVEGPNKCTNISAPCQSIAQAVAQSALEDRININPTGEYEVINIKLPPDIEIIGSNQQNPVVFNAGDVGRHFIFSNLLAEKAARLSNIHFVGGNAREGDGGCILVNAISSDIPTANGSSDSGLFLKNCHFDGCDARNGGGSCIVDSTVTDYGIQSGED